MCTFFVMFIVSFIQSSSEPLYPLQGLLLSFILIITATLRHFTVHFSTLFHTCKNSIHPPDVVHEQLINYLAYLIQAKLNFCQLHKNSSLILFDIGGWHETIRNINKLYYVRLCEKTCKRTG